MRWRWSIWAIPLGLVAMSGAIAQGAAPDDEAVARAAAKDLRPKHYYNRPGATRAQYNADWQMCGLVAAGYILPDGKPDPSNDKARSGVQLAGNYGLLPSMVVGALVEGYSHSVVLHACMALKGWRWIEPLADERARISAMNDAEQEQFFDTAIGAKQVSGTIVPHSFEQTPDPAIHLDAPVTDSFLYLGKKVDPASPVSLAPGEGAIVLAYRRTDPAAAGLSADVKIARYDPATHDLARGRRQGGREILFAAEVDSVRNKSSYEVQVLRLPAGHYVLAGKQPSAYLLSDCFGAPEFELKAGEVSYLGDYTPFLGRLSDGRNIDEILWSTHIDDARRVIALSQPALAANLQNARIRNGATYSCPGIVLSVGRWDLPGMPDVE